MKFHYYPETDSLYVHLAPRDSTDSREVAPGVVLDFDSHGALVGIDIDHPGGVIEQRDDGPLKVSEVARLLNVTPRAVRAGLNRGTIRGQRIGNKLWRVPRSEVNRLLGEELRQAGEPQNPGGERA